MSAPEQYLPALAKANEIRLARSALKQRVRAGETTIVDALTEPCAQTMLVRDLLAAQHRWGLHKARRALLAAGVVEHKTVGALTDRQRRAVVYEAGWVVA